MDEYPFSISENVLLEGIAFGTPGAGVNFGARRINPDSANMLIFGSSGQGMGFSTNLRALYALQTAKILRGIGKYEEHI